MQNLSVCITIFFIILILTNQQFDKGTIIKLSKMPSIAKLLSSSNPNNPSIVLGFADGQIRFIESSTNRTISTSKMHDTQIKHIQVNYKSNIIFIANKTSVTIYNTNYLIEKTINFQKEILGLSVAEEDDGRGFFSLHFQTRIMEEQYTIFLDKKINAAFLVIILGEEGASNVKYSKDHKYLYVINKTRSQFNIFNAENPQQIITTEVINNTNKYENNQPQKALLQLTRKFNFNIKWMIIDNKNHKDLNNKMIFVSDENTIFYADQGNIITYIPYSTYNDELIGVDFCQSNYIAILYKHVVHGEPYFYLNLVFKDNAHSYKTISLNDIFGQIESIKQIDCNYNMIIFITGRKELLILKGYQIFDYKYYITVKNLQYIGLFFLVLSFFLKDKYNEDDKISLKGQNKQYKQKVYQKEYEQSQQVSTSENSEKNNKVSRNK